MTSNSLDISVVSSNLSFVQEVECKETIMSRGSASFGKTCHQRGWGGGGGGGGGCTGIKWNSPFI